MKLILLVILMPLIALTGQADNSLRATVAAKVDAEYPNLFDLYQHLHANPELSFHEAQTSKRLAAELKAAGYEVTTGVGGFGVVAVLNNGAGPTVMVRCDLDALPVKEQTGLPYASQVTTQDDSGAEVSVMHACGHDIHMTALVGTARVLAATKSAWSGTLVLIGQPAEERGGGARAMLSDGLFTRFPKPDFCLALHDNSTLPAGTVGFTPGAALANVNSVDITVHGVGGHGSAPETTKDPIVLAAQIVLALQTIVSREISPSQPAVVTVGSIHGGTKHNIIPAEVKLQLTVRSYSDEVRNKIIAAIRRIARGQALAAGIPEDKFPEVNLSEDATPSTFNDPGLTERLAKSFRDWLPPDQVVAVKPVMGGEDFSEYGRTADKIPICLFWLGAVKQDIYEAARSEGKSLPSLHSPFWAPDPEPTIKTGVTAMTAAVLELMKK